MEPSVVLTLGGMKAHNDGWASLTDPEPAAEPAFLAMRRRKIESQLAWLKQYRDSDHGIQRNPETIRLGLAH